jgi:hypothetical protein
MKGRRQEMGEKLVKGKGWELLSVLLSLSRSSGGLAWRLYRT